jgi:hypothetical protein
MDVEFGNEEFRWQVVKAMLDEYPALREKTETYLRTQRR